MWTNSFARDSLERLVVVGRVPDISIIADDHPLRAGTADIGSWVNILLVVPARLGGKASLAILKGRPIIPMGILLTFGNPVERWLQVNCPLKDDAATLIVNLLVFDPCPTRFRLGRILRLCASRFFGGACVLGRDDDIRM